MHYLVFLFLSDYCYAHLNIFMKFVQNLQIVLLLLLLLLLLILLFTKQNKKNVSFLNCNSGFFFKEVRIKEKETEESSMNEL